MNLADLAEWVFEQDGRIEFDAGGANLEIRISIPKDEE